jgi:predicted DNA-binding protein
VKDNQLIEPVEEEDSDKERITPWVSASVAQRLRRLARRNKRTVSAEVEIAIERHLTEEEPAAMPRQ